MGLELHDPNSVIRPIAAAFLPQDKGDAVSSVAPKDNSPFPLVVLDACKIPANVLWLKICQGKSAVAYQR